MRHTVITTIHSPDTTEADSSCAAPRSFADDNPRVLAALWQEAAQALAERRARSAALAKARKAPAASRTPEEIRQERARYQFD